MRLLKPTLLGFALLAAAITAHADDFPAPLNAGDGSDGKPLSAEAAAAGFRLPPGFKANVFAAEPEVQNPVGMTWDNRGRLWVAECYTYANRPTRYDLSLRDRVIILHDKDGDGRSDERKVFCDNVQQLMSVEVGLGGVWLIALPRLLFIPDRNGDDIPDGEPEVILDGFEINSDNYHNVASGLKWGPDGWLYGRCGASSPGSIGPPGSKKEDLVPIYGGIWRYHPTRKTFEVLCHGFTNPWGHDWDDNGEMFITNTVTGHLFHLIPGAHHSRSSTFSPNRYVYDTIDSHADHFHFNTGRGWKPVAGDPVLDQLGGGHAHCGALIYQGDNWPAEYRGKLLTLNLHGRRINVDRLEREGSGYVARHEPDIGFAADEWFRGIDLNTGPDGAVYIIDWSDTGECHEHDGVHRTSGRVFRISSTATDSGAAVPTKLQRTAGSSRSQFAANEWFFRRGRAELANQRLSANKQQSTAIAEAVLKNIDPNLAPKEMVRTIWLLYALDAVPSETVLSLLDDDDEHLRAWGLRLLTDFWPIDTVNGKVRATEIDLVAANRLVEMARADQSGLVRLVLASTLQRLPTASRPALAAALLSHDEDANDHNLPKLIWYGLAPLIDSHPEWLVPLAANGKLPLTREWIARAIAEDPVKNASALEGLLAASLDKSEATRGDIARGLAAGLAGRRKAEPPKSWPAFAASVQSAEPQLQEIVRGLAVVFGDGRALDEVRRIALDDKAKVRERQAALETLIEARSDDLKPLCEKLLKVRFLNMTAMKGLTLFDDPSLGEQLAKSYTSFHPAERPAVIETLITRPAFASALLDQIAAKKIPASELLALQARQIRSYGDEELSQRLADVWGQLRDSPAEKQTLIAQLKGELTKDRLAAADRASGRTVFQTTCANCHRLFGAGGTIAPDLTGSGRHNLDYLLENIIDPSAVVNKDFRMSVVRTADGRVLNGLVTSQDDQRIVLQTPKEKLTLPRGEIDDLQLTTLSPMPEGILQPLTQTQIADLLAYLQSPSQIELPSTSH
jgi:putative membrane-bound dehydrogenase-like protein